MNNPFDIGDQTFRNLLKKALKDCKSYMVGFAELNEIFGVTPNTKNYSEILSKAAEQKISKAISEFTNKDSKYTTNDLDSDIVVNQNIPVEVKVSSGTEWMAGEFTDRPYWHILIRRDKTDNEYNKYFVCLIKMKNEYWKSTIYRNHYGATFDKKALFKLKEEGTADLHIIFGDIVQSKKSCKFILETLNI